MIIAERCNNMIAEGLSLLYVGGHIAKTNSVALWRPCHFSDIPVDSHLLPQMFYVPENVNK